MHATKSTEVIVQNEQKILQDMKVKAQFLFNLHKANYVLIINNCTQKIKYNYSRFVKKAEWLCKEIKLRDFPSGSLARAVLFVFGITAVLSVKTQSGIRAIISFIIS